MLMVALLLLVATGGTAQQSAVATADGDEIVLIGRKLRAWRGKLSVRGGRMRCATRQSTGDAAIDAIGCTAMTACFPTFEPELRAVAGGGDARAERDRRNTAINQRMTACVAARHETLIRELADRRAAARP